MTDFPAEELIELHLRLAELFPKTALTYSEAIALQNFAHDAVTPVIEALIHG